MHSQRKGSLKYLAIPLHESGHRNTRPRRTLMIIYRPIAPLTAGRTGLKSALVAMALAAVLGTTWQVSNETLGTHDLTPER